MSGVVKPFFNVYHALCNSKPLCSTVNRGYNSKPLYSTLNRGYSSKLLTPTKLNRETRELLQNSYQFYCGGENGLNLYTDYRQIHTKIHHELCDKLYESLCEELQEAVKEYKKGDLEYIYVSDAPIIADGKLLPPTPPNDSGSKDKDSLSEWVMFSFATLINQEPYLSDDEKTGKIVHNLVPSQNTKNEISGNGSSKPFPYHTENSHAQNPPDALTLICLRGDEKANTNIHRLSDLLKYLYDNHGQDIIKKLQEPNFRFKTGDSFNVPKSFVAPILYEEDGQCKIRLNTVKGRTEGLTKEDQNAVEILSNYLNNNSPDKLFVNLKAGEFLIINNGSLVHGRNPFNNTKDPDDKRWLQRTYTKKMVDTCQETLCNNLDENGKATNSGQEESTNEDIKCDKLCARLEQLCSSMTNKCKETLCNTEKNVSIGARQL